MSMIETSAFNKLAGNCRPLTEDELAMVSGGTANYGDIVVTGYASAPYYVQQANQYTVLALANVIGVVNAQLPNDDFSDLPPTPEITDVEVDDDGDRMELIEDLLANILTETDPNQASWAVEFSQSLGGYYAQSNDGLVRLIPPAIGDAVFNSMVT